jgi:uncharacterized protein
VRIPGDMPPRRPRRVRGSNDPTKPKTPRKPRTANPNRRRVVIIVVLAALLALFLSARGIAKFYTDFLWFDQLGFSSVFTGILGAKIALTLIFTTIFFVLMFVSLLIADRLAPPFPVPGPEAEFVARYRQLVGTRAGLVRLAVSALFGLIAGVNTSGRWHEWILFTNRVDFNVADEQFHKDIGFYVFQLPFISFVIGWVFTSLIVVTVVTAAAHYLNGGIRVQVPRDRVTPQVKVHLSVLLASLALVRAVGYWYDRYDLTYSSRGVVTGATYTDVKAQLPAITLLIFISLTSFVLLLVNIRRKGWVLPVLAVGLWGLIAVSAGAVYPAVVQRFFVQPSENAKERPYIERNLTATRAALGLTVKTDSYPLEQSVTAATLSAASPTLSNIALIDQYPHESSGQNLSRLAFQNLQNSLGYYEFARLDTDRYVIGGRQTQVIVGVRELPASEKPQTSWVGRHLQYTHGSGVAMAPISKLDAEGRPVFLSASDPVLTLSRPEVYFGEETSDYVLVNTGVNEITLSSTGQEVSDKGYEGAGGVPLKSRLRRLAFALRLGEPNLVVSGQLSGSSRIMYINDVRERAAKVAPFLEFDSNPYPVVTEGRLKWVIDAYTTTHRYPYGQKADTNGVNGASGLKQRFNYARNSVKAIVDAYDGTVTFHIVDSTDPLIRAYQKAFPKVFSKQVPTADLAAHFRYPEDLFRVQTNMWGRYHLDTADAFYIKSGAWVPGQAPGAESVRDSTASVATTTPIASTAQETTGGRVNPQLALMQLPGSDELQFVQTRAFAPNGDQVQKLVAFMVGAVDPLGTPSLRVLTMPEGELRPDTPLRVAQSIDGSPEVSPLNTLFCQQGSSCRQGELALVPVGNALMYVRPYYVKGAGEKSSFELKKVIVNFKNKTYVADNLGLALQQAFGSTPDLGSNGTTPTTKPPGTTPSATVQELAAEASALYVEAQAALKAGDLGGYQKLNDQINAKVQEIARVSAATGATANTPTATTAANSTASTTVPNSGAASTTSNATTAGPASTTGATTTVAPVRA